MCVLLFVNPDISTYRLGGPGSGISSTLMKEPLQTSEPFQFPPKHIFESKDPPFLLKPAFGNPFSGFQPSNSTYLGPASRTMSVGGFSSCSSNLATMAPIHLGHVTVKVNVATY